MRSAGLFFAFGNPSALTGLVYNDASTRLLERFGGAYSSIAPGLRRPYDIREFGFKILVLACSDP